MGTTEDEPLLKEGAVSIAIGLGGLRRRRSSNSRRKLRSRRRAYALIMIVIGVLLLLLYFIIGSAYRANRRRASRKKQTLQGFDRETRPFVERLPTASISIKELLQHPSVVNISRPLCSLDSIQQKRYKPLQPAYRNGPSRRSKSPHEKPHHKINYLIALNLYSASSVFPTIIQTLYNVVKTLGPSRFHISIYENGSTDQTPTQIYLFARLLEDLGVGFTIVSSTTPRDTTANKRITGLANLRNLALAPAYNAPPGTFDRVIFLNDVLLCEGDLMELLLQHEVQDADMSCGMDHQYLRIKEFKEQGYPLLFYDTWVARDMLGLPFYEIKYPTGDWVLPSSVLPLSPSRGRYHSLLPFQVYSCFNGIAAIDASIFESPSGLRFRSVDGTDRESECFLFCRDLWEKYSPISIAGRKSKTGRGARIQVVPRVSVGYQMDEYAAARKDTNTTDMVRNQEEELFAWNAWPPKLVASYPFARWNEEAWIPPF